MLFIVTLAGEQTRMAIRSKVRGDKMLTDEISSRSRAFTCITYIGRKMKLLFPLDTGIVNVFHFNYAILYREGVHFCENCLFRIKDIALSIQKNRPESVFVLTSFKKCDRYLELNI